MAKPKANSVINAINNPRFAYRIEGDALNTGNMAISYAARDEYDNKKKKVFLKFYISPTPTIPWYKDYVSYVKEVNRRIANAPTKDFCVGALACFEGTVDGGNPKFAKMFQVFEFIEGGHDLESLLKNGGLSWGKRLTMAKVFLNALKEMHAAKIVHTDLKTANVQMLPVPYGIGFKPLLIDMDFSVLSDKQAPWHGTSGYIGTPNWQSPEHLRGETPRFASDVFTAALILYELLGQGNPYLKSDDYKRSVLSETPPKIRFHGNFRKSSDAEKLADLLLRALSVDAAQRPTASKLHNEILDIDVVDGIDNVDASPLPPRPKQPSPKPSASPTASAICLVGDLGRKDLRISQKLGKGTLAETTSAYLYTSQPQFELIHSGDCWTIRHCSEAKNLTLVNNKQIAPDLPLKDGDKIQVSNAALTVIKEIVAVSFPR